MAGALDAAAGCKHWHGAGGRCNVTAGGGDDGWGQGGGEETIVQSNGEAAQPPDCAPARVRGEHLLAGHWQRLGAPLAAAAAPDQLRSAVADPTTARAGPTNRLAVAPTAPCLPVMAYCKPNDCG